MCIEDEPKAIQALPFFRDYSRTREVEAELKALDPLSPEVRRFLSFEGFAELYLRMRDLYPTQLEAYERLEDFYITITGKRRYSEFSSFRRVLNRKKM